MNVDIHDVYYKNCNYNYVLTVLRATFISVQCMYIICVFQSVLSYSSKGSVFYV